MYPPHADIQRIAELGDWGEYLAICKRYNQNPTAFFEFLKQEYGKYAYRYSIGIDDDSKSQDLNPLVGLSLPDISTIHIRSMDKIFNLDGISKIDLPSLLELIIHSPNGDLQELEDFRSDSLRELVLTTKDSNFTLSLPNLKGFGITYTKEFPLNILNSSELSGLFRLSICGDLISNNMSIDQINWSRYSNLQKLYLSDFTRYIDNYQRAKFSLGSYLSPLKKLTILSLRGMFSKMIDPVCLSSVKELQIEVESLEDIRNLTLPNLEYISVGSYRRDILKHGKKAKNYIRSFFGKKDLGVTLYNLVDL